jgi:hypothetical protein
MNDVGRTSPRRYVLDHQGRRVLVGLTIEETFEFEKLDQSAPPDGFGEQRWCELYGKHDRAWVRWMADTRVQRDESLLFLN